MIHTQLQSIISRFHTPFPHSNKQWHRVEVWVDKNTANVWKCPPEARSGSTVRTHWSGMRERSIDVLFPVHLVENVINHYLTLTRQDCNFPASISDTTRTFYFKLHYIGPFSIITQKKVRHVAKCYCNNIDIKLVFSSFKIGNLFSVKDPIPRGLHAGVVYKFLCAGCSACYVSRWLFSDKTSHIFKHLQNSEHCSTLCSNDCFSILDHASTTFQLKTNEPFIFSGKNPHLIINFIMLI